MTKKDKKTIPLCAVKDYIDIDRLNFYPNNPRKISPERLSLMKASIQEKGFYEPILIRKKGNIILSGNHRTRAVLEMIDDGYEFVAPDGSKGVLPVVIADVDDETAEAILFETNNHYAEWVEDQLQRALTEANEAGKNIKSFGFTQDDIDRYVIKATEEAKTTVAEHERALPGDTDDELPEKVVTKVKTGEVWQLGRHRVMCGDSTNAKDVETLLNGQPVEMCFTSPPYSDQRDYKSKDGAPLDLSPDVLAKFIEVSREYVRLFAVNLGLSRKNGEVYQYWDTYIKAAQACGLKLLSWNVWSQGFSGSVAKLTAMFPIAHEWILVFGEKPKRLNPTVENKTAGKFNTDTSVREIDGEVTEREPVRIREKREMGTVVDVPPYMARNEDLDHPAMFPVALPEAYIEACTDEDEIVYDAFAGSGSTLIAAEKTNRRCFAMEIEPTYCGIIIDRWERFTQLKADRIHPPVVLKQKKKTK
jgi:DNA modification methylase